MVGESMVAWATDAVVQDGLLAYVKANWQKSANTNSPGADHDILVNTGAGEQGVPNISGIGLGVYYRYGTYGLPTFKENIAIKFSSTIVF